jgi:methylaspartate ammonia-lyase
MSQIDVITNALVMPGVSVDSSTWSILVGLVIDDRRIAWGTCSFNRATSEADFGLNDGIYLLQESIIPSLIGQPLADLPDLMSQLDEMRREVEVVRPITAETPPPKRSRRELFSSLVNPSQEIREAVERPIPPELRQGVSQALVSAVALTQERMAVEAVAELYGLKGVGRPLAVHLEFADLPNPNDPALSRIAAASYGLAAEEGEALAVLGRDGVRLQNRLRQLKNRVKRHIDTGRADQTTSFLFDLQGGYGSLYDNNSGRMLGAINGLEQTAKPFPLWLIDPVITADWQSHLERLKELQSFVRLRKMRTMLLARAGVETAEAVHALADNACCGGVLLDMVRLGTLHRTIELAGTARKRGLEVVLAGVKGETAVQAALALNPALVIVGAAEVSNIADEMNRAVGWMSVKK